MNKNDLLLSIGFSEDYIAYLNRIDLGEPEIVDAISEDIPYQSLDASNVIIHEARTNFGTEVTVKKP